MILGLSTTSITAEDQPRFVIEIYTEDLELVDAVLFENTVYHIVVVPENQTEDELVVFDVTLNFLDIVTVTSRTNPFYQFTAPLYDQHESFLITATKEGYAPAQLEVTVVIGQLSVTIDKSIVEEKKEFLVTVKDLHHNPISDAAVLLTSHSIIEHTDLYGNAYIQAPAVQQSTNLMIQATKPGYLSTSKVIRVEHVSTSGLNLSSVQFLQLLPILLAGLVVVLAIIYVLWRQKRKPQMPFPQTKPASSNEQPSVSVHPRQQKHDSALFSVEKKTNAAAPPSTSKVEEIRIPIQEKKKDTTYITEEKKPQQPTVNPDKDHDEWFKGQNYMRYKIDELTGKIDQQTDGKWFEGERDCKYKVDETLKKKSIKKKQDNTEDDT